MADLVDVLFLGLGAIGYCTGRSSRSSILPQVVSAEIFSNAITWNSSIFHIASMTGPALGGLMSIGIKPPLRLSHA